MQEPALGKNGRVMTFQNKQLQSHGVATFVDVDNVVLAPQKATAVDT